MVMTTYNHEQFITAALDSLLTQSPVVPQVILIDDASTDQTVSIVEGWLISNPDLDITFIPHRTNKGFVQSLNLGLAQAKGKNVCTFSGDDVMRPNRLKKQLDFLEGAPAGTGAVYSDMRFIDVEGAAIGSWSWGLPFRIRSSVDDVLFELLRYNCFPIPGAMFRREVFETLEGFDSSLDFEDYDLWLRMSDRYTISYLPTIVSDYRVRPDSMSRGMHYRDRMLRSQVRLFQKRINHSDKARRLIRLKALELALEAASRSFPETAKMALSLAEKTETGRLGAFFPKLIDNPPPPAILALTLSLFLIARKISNLCRLGLVRLRNLKSLKRSYQFLSDSAP